MLPQTEPQQMEKEGLLHHLCSIGARNSSESGPFGPSFEQPSEQRLLPFVRVAASATIAAGGFATISSFTELFGVAAGSFFAATCFS